MKHGLTIIGILIIKIRRHDSHIFIMGISYLERPLYLDAALISDR